MRFCLDIFLGIIPEESTSTDAPSNNFDYEFLVDADVRNVPFDDPNYTYFPFINNEFEFYAKGEGTLKISLTMYPIESNQLFNYKLHMDSASVVLTKEGLGVDTKTEDFGFLTNSFQHYKLSIVEVIDTTTTTEGSEVTTGVPTYHHELILHNIEDQTDAAYVIDASVDLIYIGFGAQDKTANLMIDIKNIVKEEEK